jgi:hypothetical protein
MGAGLPYWTEEGLERLSVFACQSLGLVFAFGNETGATTFATNFGPSNPNMPDTAAGDAAFAAAASSAIFGSQATADTAIYITSHISYWVNLYTASGLPGTPNPTANQIDLAARGAVWGEAVGVALANNLGPLVGQPTNFLEDAAQGTAVYSASLSSQPPAGLFQGAAAASAASVAATGTHVQMTGVAALLDHVVM